MLEGNKKRSRPADTGDLVLASWYILSRLDNTSFPLRRVPNTLPARKFHLRQLSLPARVLSQTPALGADPSKRFGNLVPRISQVTSGDKSWLAMS